MSRKFIALISILLIAGLILGACGKSSAPSGGGQQQPQGKEITLTIGFTESQTGKYNVSSITRKQIKRGSL